MIWTISISLDLFTLSLFTLDGITFLCEAYFHPFKLFFLEICLLDLTSVIPFFLQFLCCYVLIFHYHLSMVMMLLSSPYQLIFWNFLWSCVCKLLKTTCSIYHFIWSFFYLCFDPLPKGYDVLVLNEIILIDEILRELLKLTIMFFLFSLQTVIGYYLFRLLRFHLF